MEKQCQDLHCQSQDVFRFASQTEVAKRELEDAKDKAEETVKGMYGEYMRLLSTCNEMSP